MYFLSKLRKKARDYTYVQRWMLPSEGSCSMSKSDRFACQCNCKSHKSEKRCIACSREEGHGAISKVMPSLSQESVRTLGHPHALTYRGTCVAESFLSMLVWSQNLRRWQIHFGHSYSRPWNIWKVKGWKGILLRMFSQHYQVLETRQCEV